MGLREWLMILGGLILLLIIADGIRRMRKVATQDEQMDEEERARQEQLRRELPTGSARIIKSHDVEVFDDDPIPVLRHEVDIPAMEDEPPVSLSAEASADLARSLEVEASYEDQALESSRTEKTDVDTDFGEAETQGTVASEHAQSPDDASYDTDPSSETAGYDESFAEPADAAYSENPETDSDSAAFAEDAGADDEAYFTGQAEAAAEEPSEAVTHDASDSQMAGYAQNSADELHVTEFEAVDNNLDDLEPLEPLEKRFAAAKARRLEEEQKLDLQRQKDAEEEAAALEEVDPVKAAVRRIQGKHTGPRPSERMKMRAPENDEMSLAERQYHEQQESAHKAQAAALKVEQQKAERAKHGDQAEPEKAERPVPEKADEKTAPAARTTFKERPVTRKPMMSADEERGQISDADELLVMHVKCKDERGFHGAALLHIVMQCGMQIGDMKVFHRFAKTEDGPQIQFSMMSSVNPGVFDIDQIDDLYIPSVSFVMGLPAPGNSQECFTMMLETAKVIVRHMSGELRDENRSVMTPQTVEHYKQRIQDFERRKQLARMR